MVVSISVTNIGADTVEFLEVNALLYLTPNGNAVLTSDLVQELLQNFDRKLNPYYTNDTEWQDYYIKTKSDGTEITLEEIKSAIGKEIFEGLNSRNLDRVIIEYR